jgi:hypothetical protein
MSIDEEIGKLNTLRSAATAIVDYVKDVAASDPIFESEFKLSDSGEWIMRPDNWIRLAFRFKNTETIEISLGMPPGKLVEHKALQALKGHYAGWTRVSVKRPKELAAAMSYIDQAFLNSDNRFRRGEKPRPPKARLTGPQKLDAAWGDLL